MHIDIFTHILPKPFYERMMDESSPYAFNIQTRVRGVPCLSDLDTRFRMMDQFRDYCQVLSLAAPPIEALGNADRSTTLARLANDAMAELVARHPDRFPAFVAALPMNAPDAGLSELERAVDQLGARGVQFYTNVNGKPLDRPEFRDLFAAMAERDLPIWLHPNRGSRFSDYDDEPDSKFEMWWVFGWPYETSVAMAHIVFAGLFDRHPGLKIIAHHAGAMIPFFSGRIGPGLDQLGARTPEADKPRLTEHHLQGRPFDYFKKFYADTALFGAAHGIRCALDFFGADHMLFASDMPFDPEKGTYNIRVTLADLDSLNLDPAVRQAIDEGNARRLLRLDAGTRGAGRRVPSAATPAA
jgi:aminocarboxymuconate-semialdehyde decarboxylase